MKKIPDKIYNLYVSFLNQQKVLSKEIPFYLKWLRYYLDFCDKYSHNSSQSASLPHFKQKLKQKHQSERQIAQAKYAITLYYKLIESYRRDQSATNSQVKECLEYATTSASNILKNQSWKNEFEMLDNEIKIRKYSRKKLRAYTLWVQSFQAYLKSKSPKQLDSIDAKKFITHLAVEKQVSVSTQNQAFNSLLFFYRHVLKKEFGNFKDIPRAKRTRYTPSVLSRKEIDDIIDNLNYPYDLVAKLLYGCGLRLTECLNLRIRDFDFDEGIVTIY